MLLHTTAPLMRRARWQLRLSQQTLAAVVIVGVGAFQIATIRPGHSWGDDFAMYIQQAENLVAGLPFTSSGYIYNRSYPDLGPPSYPPLYPLVIAPVYRAFGLNLTAMKVVGIACFVMALLLVSLIFASSLEPPALVLLIAAVGLNPFLWQQKDQIGSDLLFFFLSMLALYVMTMFERGNYKSFSLALCLGLTVYLCYATRTAGAILLLCVPVSEFINRRKISRATLGSGLIAGTLIFVHSLVFRAVTAYLDQMHFSEATFMRDAKQYYWEFHNNLWPFFNSWTAALFTWTMIGLGAAGYLIQARKRHSVWEVFAVVYGGVFLVWPTEADTRFLIPLIPLWVYYVLVCVRDFAARFMKPIPHAATILIVGALTASYASAYSRMDYSPIAQGIADRNFLQACDYIRTQTSPESVIIFAKPRLLALLTGRHASPYHQPPDDRDLLTYFSRISATHILVARDLERDVAYMQAFVARHSASAQVVYANGVFTLYRIRPE
jgi:hypothetical protein